MPIHGLTLLAAAALRVNWQQAPLYNTIMSVAAGVGLLLVVFLIRDLGDGRPVHLDGWAVAFGTLGVILVVTGAHMTVTWPLAGLGTPHANVIFGEPSLAFGAMLLAAAAYLWRRGDAITQRLGGKDAQGMLAELAGTALPLSYFASAMGLGLIAIAVAGMRYTLFAAPPQEPLSGYFADRPRIEATFVSGLFALTGLGAFLLPFLLRSRSRGLGAIVSFCWTVAGVIFTLFGVLNYFTHIGLILHTM